MVYCVCVWSSIWWSKAMPTKRSIRFDSHTGRGRAHAPPHTIHPIISVQFCHPIPMASIPSSSSSMRAHGEMASSATIGSIPPSASIHQPQATNNGLNANASASAAATSASYAATAGSSTAVAPVPAHISAPSQALTGPSRPMLNYSTRRVTCFEKLNLLGEGTYGR